jgi:hypothetical protein
MSKRLMRWVEQFCESAAWCYATGDPRSGRHFLDAATKALALTDGGSVVDFGCTIRSIQSSYSTS